MNQKLSILVNGKDGVDPNSLGQVLHAAFRLLESIDKASWPVDAPRVKWRVSELTLVNPATVTAIGEDVLPSERPAPNFAIRLVEGLASIDRGIRPIGYTDKDLQYARILGQQAQRNKEIVLVGVNGVRKEGFTVPHRFVGRVSKLLREQKTISQEYGSIDGTLIALSNDPLKDEGSAKIRDRFTSQETFCHADPETSARLGQTMDRKTRVVLYGMITYENGFPKSIKVEDIATIPTDEKLASIEDIHAMNLRPPAGMSVEDYLDDLRGDD